MINYNNIQQSIDFYSKNGFERIETPWLVTEATDAITRPKDAVPYTVESKNKNLVASGEQGFLYLYMKEYLPLGKFQTVTPCFRNDPFDLTHTKYFMKNELIITDIVNEGRLMELIGTSKEFFDNFFEGNTEVISTSDGYDIVIGGEELGSYGIRDCDFLTWIYGTGCAEPRLSRLIKKYEEKGTKNRLS